MKKESLDNLKEEYTGLGKVFCPFLNSEIAFNNKGFRHILYKSGNRKRDQLEISQRVTYLRTAKDILSITTTVQEKEIIEKTKENKIYYFGFIAIMDELKIKVVIRKENENGKYHFYSVIPHFITSAKRDIGKTNTNTSGTETEIETKNINEKTTP